MSYFPIKIIITEPTHQAFGESFTIASPEDLLKGVAFKVVETGEVSEADVLEAKEPLNTGHFSEAMDRCSLISTLIEDFLIKQAAIQRLPEAEKALMVAVGIIQNCYQLLGSLDFYSGDYVKDVISPYTLDTVLQQVIKDNLSSNYYEDLAKTVQLTESLYSFMLDTH